MPAVNALGSVLARLKDLNSLELHQLTSAHQL
jgi:capsid protein